MKHITRLKLKAAKIVGAKYDAVCKELFLNKEILAPVLKEVVAEYKNCTIEEIIDCIDEASIKSSPVDETSMVVDSQISTEMHAFREKLIRYDARFIAVNPKLSNESITFLLHIDIEIQNNYRTNYSIVKRAIYYAAREISSQLDVLTKKTNYNSIQKCYSIWICNERIPKNLRNTVSSYSIQKEDLIGNSEEPIADYDLMTVIIIRRGDNEGTDKIFDYLNGIFKADLGTINKYVDVGKKTELKKEILTMSGLGMSIAKKNFEKGFADGEIKGFATGRINTLIDLVRIGLLSIKDAARTAGLTEDEFEKKLLNSNKNN